MQYHATVVDIDGLGVMLRGDSGMGKSDLALRLIERGASLVSDDYIDLAMRDGDLYATAPENIKGMMEVRGVGVVNVVSIVVETKIALVVDLVAQADEPRMPDEHNHVEMLGLSLPRIELYAFHASTPAKVRVALLGRVEFL